LSDLVERFDFHEDRAKGLVSSLGGPFGIEEEPAGVIPIHDAGSRVLIIFRPETSAERTPEIRVEKGSRHPSPGQELENKGGKPGMHSHRHGNESVDGNPRKSFWAGKTINDPRADLTESP
jgi:hypothetical protein